MDDVSDTSAASPEEEEKGGKAAGDEARPAAYPSYVEELQELLASGEARVDEIRRGAAKLRDEQLSRIRRLERDLQDRVDRSVGDAMEGLLEVVDHLDLAIQAGEKSSEVDSLLEGLRMVRESFLQTLGRQGLERIELVGRAFDPELAEATGVEEVEEADRDNVVLQERRPGYRFRGRLLRPANVVVGRHAGNGPEAVPSASPPSEEKSLEPVEEETDAAAVATDEIEDPSNEEGVDTWLETGESPPPSGAEPEDYRPIRAPHPEAEETEGAPDSEAAVDEEGEEDEDAGAGESSGPAISPAQVDFEDLGEEPSGSDDLDWES